MDILDEEGISQVSLTKHFLHINYSSYFINSPLHVYIDDPALSDTFARKDAPNPLELNMFVCEVLLGHQYDMSANPIETPLGADFFPPPGYDSVKGLI